MKRTKHFHLLYKSQTQTLYLSPSPLEWRKYLLISWVRTDTGLSTFYKKKKEWFVCTNTTKQKCSWNTGHLNTWMLKLSRMHISSSFFDEIIWPKGLNNVWFLNSWEIFNLLQCFNSFHTDVSTKCSFKYLGWNLIEMLPDLLLSLYVLNPSRVILRSTVMDWP